MTIPLTWQCTHGGQRKSVQTCISLLITKTMQSILWCSSENGGLLDQVFAVVDKAIFIEVSNVTFLNALLASMGVYFAF